MIKKIPFPADDNLLTTRELKLSPPQSLLSMVTMSILTPHRQKHLPNRHPSASTQGLSKSASHTGLKPISTSARKHLVDPQNMERVHPNPQMESIFSRGLHHVLVASDTRGFEGFAGDVLLLPGDEVDAERELVDAFLLHADVVDPDFGIGDTAAVARFRVGLALDLTVTPRRSCNANQVLIS